MRALRPLACLMALALVAGPGSAGAASLFFTGILTLDLPSAFSPVTFAGMGVATGSGAGFSLPGDAFTGSEVATTPSWVAPPITGNLHIVSGHGPGSFSVTPSAAACRSPAASTCWRSAATSSSSSA